LKSPHGRQFVLQQGVAERISRLLESALNDPFADLYVPGQTTVANMSATLLFTLPWASCDIMPFTFIDLSFLLLFA